jgi:hypothetical protein
MYFVESMDYSIDGARALIDVYKHFFALIDKDTDPWVVASRIPFDQENDIPAYQYLAYIQKLKDADSMEGDCMTHSEYK